MGWKTILFPLHPPTPPSPCSRSSCFHSLFPSNAHTHTITHTRNNSLSTPRGVTNFSWALDVGLREVEMEKMKERGEAVLRWQLGGSHPHRKEPYTTSHLIFLAARPSFLSQRPARAQSTQHARCLFGTVVNLIIVYSPVSGTGDTSQAMCMVLPSVRRNWNLRVLFLHPIWDIFAGFRGVEWLPISRALFTLCVLLTTGWYKYQLL